MGRFLVVLLVLIFLSSSIFASVFSGALQYASPRVVAWLTGLGAALGLAAGELLSFVQSAAEATGQWLEDAIQGVADHFIASDYAHVIYRVFDRSVRSSSDFIAMIKVSYDGTDYPGLSPYPGSFSLRQNLVFYTKAINDPVGGPIKYIGFRDFGYLTFYYWSGSGPYVASGNVLVEWLKPSVSDLDGAWVAPSSRYDCNISSDTYNLLEPYWGLVRAMMRANAYVRSPSTIRFYPIVSVSDRLAVDPSTIIPEVIGVPSDEWVLSAQVASLTALDDPGFSNTSGTFKTVSDLIRDFQPSATVQGGSLWLGECEFALDSDTGDVFYNGGKVGYFDGTKFWASVPAGAPYYVIYQGTPIAWVDNGGNVLMGDGTIVGAYDGNSLSIAGITNPSGMEVRSGDVTTVPISSVVNGSLPSAETGGLSETDSLAIHQSASSLQAIEDYYQQIEDIGVLEPATSSTFWDKLKDFISYLFVPSDGFWNSELTALQNVLSDRVPFGFAYVGDNVVLVSEGSLPELDIMGVKVDIFGSLPDDFKQGVRAFFRFVVWGLFFFWLASIAIPRLVID